MFAGCSHFAIDERMTSPPYHGAPQSPRPPLPPSPARGGGSIVPVLPLFAPERGLGGETTAEPPASQPSRNVALHPKRRDLGPLLLAVALFALALPLRLLVTDRFVTTDELFWIGRSAAFGR